MLCKIMKIFFLNYKNMFVISMQCYITVELKKTPITNYFSQTCQQSNVRERALCVDSAREQIQNKKTLVNVRNFVKSA